MRRLFSIWVLLIFSFSAGATSPAQIQFLKKIRSFDSKKESVSYAKKVLEDKDSPYRNYAVEFFRELRDPTYIDLLMKYMDDRDIQTFVLYALGDLQAYEATDALIEKLKNPNPNVRGNAHQALMRIYPLKLPEGYRFGQPRRERNQNIATIENWWADNRVKLLQGYKRDLSQNSQAQQEAWEKYGQQYIRSQ
jgi:hypothetical protein